MGLKNGWLRSCRSAGFEGTLAVVDAVGGLTTNFDIASVVQNNRCVHSVDTVSRFDRMTYFLENTASALSQAKFILLVRFTRLLMLRNKVLWQGRNHDLNLP